MKNTKIKVGGMAIYNNGFYGDMSVIITSRENNCLGYWAFMGLQSYGYDKRKEFRQMTAKEFKRVEEYSKKKKNESEMIEKALTHG